jgi:hypothetical protein
MLLTIEAVIRGHGRVGWVSRFSTKPCSHNARSRAALHWWRQPTADELSLLVWISEEPPPPEELNACICLFQLPEHLRSRWWNLLVGAARTLDDGRLPGFETFVSQVVEFLAFKSLPVPEGVRCDLVVSNPELHRANRDGGFCGRRLWGKINLGDEPTSVVLINLTRRQMGAELHRRFHDQPSALEMSGLFRHFLRFCSDYPPVRLILEPGDGCRLPSCDMVLDHYLEGKREPDVTLLISQGAEAPLSSSQSPGKSW